MQKLEYDELLGEYLDENGNIYSGLREVDIENEVSQPYISPLNNNAIQIEQEKQQQQAIVLQKTITSLKEQLKLAEQQQAEINAQLLKGMQENDIYKIELDNVSIIRKKESVQKRLDAKRLEEEMPMIAEQYKKDVVVGEHIEIRIKKNKE